jgi:hypothetical protein
VDSARRRGKSARRAKEIAARTVNKTRRRQGRTANTSTRGRGNPSVPLAERTKQELYNIAADRGIEGRSKMSKRQLVRALQKR